jgi:hypothetical protein
LNPALADPSIIYLGMDVHKDSITLALLPMGAKSPTRLDWMPNESPKLEWYLTRLARAVELRWLRGCDLCFFGGFEPIARSRT